LKIYIPAARIIFGHPLIEHNSPEIIAATTSKSNTEGTVSLDTVGCSEALLLFVVGLETFCTSCPFVELKRQVTS
jgi:hypothetical protein